MPEADPTASVLCGEKRKAEGEEDITHQHKQLKVYIQPMEPNFSNNLHIYIYKTNTLEMSPSQETKEHLEDIKVRRKEGQPVGIYFP